MALTITKFYSGVNTTPGAGPWNFTVSAPNADKLYVVFVGGWYNSTTNLGTWSISWSGMTWTTEKTQFDTNSTDVRESVFSAQSGGSPSGGTTLAVSNTTSADDAIVCVLEIDGYDTSTPVVQSNGNLAASASSVSVSLSALGSASNAVVIGGVNYNGGNAITGGGYSLVSNDPDSTDVLGHGVSSKNPGDTSPVLTFDTSGPLTAIALEIKAAAGGGATRPVKMAGEWGGYAGTSGGFAG